ncbi:hypothetical protein LU293_01840 [Moraxella nasovis]|uniref:hypothetical protein n=1 Tax=Moraxella nasovis TaxID=2904121 RepID=UPI001F60175F|nr:hypothetical protein [Moraxella nasovis]UNU73677.1 hypothetical protein LU293_01840 [Moraxella nasovis]
MKIQQLLKQSIAVPTLVALTLVGCDKPKENEEFGEDVVIEPVLQDVDVMCDAAVNQYRLVDAVRQTLLAEALLIVQEHQVSQDDELDGLVRHKIDNIAIKLQNVVNQHGDCSADVVFELSPQDVKAADGLFTQYGLPTLQEQAIQVNAALIGGRVIANDVSYALNSEQANLHDKAATTLVAHILVAAVNQGASSFQATLQPRVLETETLDSSRADEMMYESQSNETSNRLEVQSIPKPKLEPKTQVRAEPKNDARAEPKPVVKSEPKPKLEPETKTKAETKPKPKLEPETKPEPKAVPTQATSSATGDLELTIVESDETY